VAAFSSTRKPIFRFFDSGGYDRLMIERARSRKSDLIHPWDVDLEAAVEIQEKLRTRLSLKDGLNFRNVRWIAGADVAYAAEGDAIFGAVVVLDFPQLSVAEEIRVKSTVKFPYIPGLLSFRETPVLIDAFSLLKQWPDVVLFDAHGIAHPRGCGLASHAGLLLDLPSVGCAKTRLVGEYEPPEKTRGSISWLWLEGSKVGAVVRTRSNVKPLFVSPGHKITTRTAVRLVLAACRSFRIPEPIRKAHQLANRVRA
jgi:deoxyribonuclease V